MLQALSRRFRVRVVSWFPVDLAQVDRHYGTRLSAAGLDIRTVPAGWRVAFGLLPVPAVLARNSLLMRRARRHGPGPLRVSANNECDFGSPGIQYVHFPWAFRPRPTNELRWYHRPPGLAAGYLRACVALAGFSFERMRRNLTLVNSRWTGERFRERHGADYVVLHPPAAGEFPEVAWQARSDDFVCAGRFSTEKRYELLVEIVGRLRERGHPGRLHVVGVADDPRYTRSVRGLARSLPWVELHEDVSRQELIGLLSGCRYLLHGMRDEHFGMTIAEAVRAGCVPFVAAGGGAVEVIGPELRDQLTWESVADAVRRFERVVQDAGALRDARDRLAARADALSERAFMDALLEHVDAFRERATTA